MSPSLSAAAASVIDAAREQWNDGSNTFCIAPGKVIAYSRNYVTNKAMEDAGVQVLTIPSSELSRGTGWSPLHDHAPGARPYLDQGSGSQA